MTALKINRKNTASYNLTITEDDVAKNINGYTVKFTVKKNTNDLDNDDVDAIIAKTVTATSSVGLVTISLTTSDTTVNPGSFMYDIKLKNSTGSWVKSIEADKFIINGVVTNG
jgi:hypothetical protein